MAERAAPHRLGVRVDRAGRRTCSISHLTGQPANVSSPRADSRSRCASVARTTGSSGRVERRGRRALLGGRLRAAQLVRRRRLGRRPGDLGQQPAAAALPQLVREQRAHVVQERRRLLRPALLVGAAEREEQHLLGARHAGVEQPALARQRVLVAGQDEPRGLRQLRPGAVVQERLRDRPLRQLALLQAAHEHGPEAARADRQRVGEQDARRRRGVAVADLDGGERLEQLLRLAGERGIGGRELGQLADRRAELARGAGGGLLVGDSGRRRGACAARSRSSRPPPAEHPGTARAASVGELVELGQLAAAELRPVPARVARGARLVAADLDLEPVGELRGGGGGRSLPGVRSHVTTSFAVPPGARRGRTRARRCRAASARTACAARGRPGCRSSRTPARTGRRRERTSTAMSSRAIPSRSSSSTEAPTSSASARSPPASSSRTAPLGETRRRGGLEQRALEVVERAARVFGA